MEDLQRLLQSQLRGEAMTGDMPLNDTAEQIQISSLALLKMLRHGIDVLPILYRKGWCSNGSHGPDARRIY